MGTYCNLINFPQIAKDILLNDKNIAKLRIQLPEPRGQFPVSLDRFPKEFNQWLVESTGLIVNRADVLFMKANNRHRIHTDGVDITKSIGKLNFIIGGMHSEMIWYKPIDLEKLRFIEFPPSKLRFTFIEEDNAKELYRTKLTDFCIVDAGTFHTVVNPIEDRISWNLHLSDYKSGTKVLFSDLQSRLGDYILS